MQRYGAARRDRSLYMRKQVARPYIVFLVLQQQLILLENETCRSGNTGLFVLSLLVSLLSNTKMDEGVSVKHEGKNVDIKQEKQENVDSFKYEFDSGSQDSSKSGSGGYQRWAPNLNGVRKSAFTPYKSVQCTALTNLQRGNIIYRISVSNVRLFLDVIDL